MAWPSNPDDEVLALIQREIERQNTTIQLIASENFTSPAVLRATGSVLTNKYSEGYPGKRYYGGNEVIDEVENVARERAKALFNAPHANVQPHAGANANMAVYLALLNPGDTVLGLRLDQGGHLTHGSPVNASGKLYDFVSYGVTPSDERIDLDQVRDAALEHRPKIIVTGATAYPRIIDPAPVPRHRRRGGRAVHVRRRAHRRAHRRWAAPEPDGPRRRHHDADHPQDPPGSARRRHPLHRRAGRGDRQVGLPGSAGRAARPRHRGQGPRLRRGGHAGVQGRTRPRSSATRPPWPRRWPATASAWCPAAPTTT